MCMHLFCLIRVTQSKGQQILMLFITNSQQLCSCLQANRLSRSVSDQMLIRCLNVQHADRCAPQSHSVPASQMRLLRASWQRGVFKFFSLTTFHVHKWLLGASVATPLSVGLLFVSPCCFLGGQKIIPENCAVWHCVQVLPPLVKNDSGQRSLLSFCCLQSKENVLFVLLKLISRMEQQNVNRQDKALLPQCLPLSYRNSELLLGGFFLVSGHSTVLLISRTGKNSFTLSLVFS